MTAVVKVFDITKHDSSSTSATAIIDEMYPLSHPGDHFIPFVIGNTGVLIKIPVE